MVRIYISILCMNAVVFFCNSVSAESSEVAKFDGQESGKSPVFEVVGPWTLDWSARSEFPLLASIDIRLHDGETGEFVGTVVELEGIGRGLKLLDDSGSYQIVVVGRSVTWEVEISEVSEQQAAELERGAQGGGLHYLILHGA